VSTLDVRWLSVTALAAMLVLGCAQLSFGNTSQQLQATVALALGLSVLSLWVIRDAGFNRVSFRAVLITLLISRALAFFVSPLLEDDYFRYLWDGYVSATTGNPFAHPPADYFGDSTVPITLQTVLSGVNNPHLPTVYGPVLQGVFALAYAVSPAELWPLKFVLLVAEVAMLWVLRQSGVASRWLLLLTLHPLLIKDSAITAHPDVLIGIALLVGTIFWQRAMFASAAVVVAVAAAMKVSVVVVLPLFCINHYGRFTLRGCVAMVLALLCAYMPTLLMWSSSAWAGLQALGEHWVFNPLLYRGLVAALGDGVARWIAAVTFALAWCALFVFWLGQLRARHTKNAIEKPVIPPVVPVIAVLLLWSPVVNPWYWLWVLPLATLRFSAVVWVAATVSLLAYVHVWEAAVTGTSLLTFAVPVWATVVQLLAISAVVVWTWRHADHHVDWLGMRVSRV
jgi:alpha-1,6-mannosyltransferase